MLFVIALAIVSVAVILGVMYAHHAGQGERLEEGLGMFRDGLSRLMAILREEYHDGIIPLFRRLRIAVMVVLVLGGVTALFLAGDQLVQSASSRVPETVVTGKGVIVANALYHAPLHVSFGVALFILLVAGVGAAAVWFLGRPQPEQTGRVTLPAAEIQRGMATIVAGSDRVVVNFAAVATPPVIKITPFDETDEFTVQHVTEQSFTLVLSQPVTERHTFNWEAAVKPRAVVNFLPVNTVPIIRIRPFDGDRGFEITDITNDSFALLLDELPTAPRVINWTVRERPASSPVVDISTSTVWSLLALGIAYFICGISFGSRMYVAMSIPFVAMSLYIFFKVWQLMAKIAELAADTLEMGPNLVLRLTQAALTRNWKKLEEMMEKHVDSSQQAISLVNQEQWEKTRQQTALNVTMALVLLYSLCILSPSWPFLTAALLVQGISVGALWILWRTAKSDNSFFKNNFYRVEYFVAKAKERGLYLYYGLVTLIAVCVATIILVPGAEGRFDELLAALCTLGLGTVEGATSAILKGLAWLVGAILSAGVVMVLWPKRSNMLTFTNKQGIQVTEPAREPSFPRLRKLLAFPFALILLACIAGFIWVMVQGVVVEVSATMLSKFIPHAEATSVPGVKLTWPTVPGATGYHIERRELHQAKYVLLADDVGKELLFTRGVTAYEDLAKVERGKMYFYRVIALGALTDGGDITSTETSVLVPQASSSVSSTNVGSVDSSATTGKNGVAGSPGHGARGKHSACSGKYCGNSGLDAYCRRHPDVCDGTDNADPDPGTDSESASD